MVRVLLYAGVPPYLVPRYITSQLVMCGAKGVEYVTPEENARMDADAGRTPASMDSDRLPWHMVMASTTEAELLYEFSRVPGVEFGIWLGLGHYDASCFGIRVQFNKASQQLHKPSPPFLRGPSMTWGFQIPST
eukprot:3412583-Rhodomonas_salina.1